MTVVREFVQRGGVAHGALPRFWKTIRDWCTDGKGTRVHKVSGPQ